MGFHPSMETTGLGDELLGDPDLAQAPYCSVQTLDIPAGNSENDEDTQSSTREWIHTWSCACFTPRTVLRSVLDKPHHG